MRRDKTLKLCANHFITPQMDLKPTANCDRAWMYFVKADYIDETVKSHLLAVKFSNIESKFYILSLGVEGWIFFLLDGNFVSDAQKWKDAWDEAKKIVQICKSKFVNWFEIYSYFKQKSLEIFKHFRF